MSEIEKEYASQIVLGLAEEVLSKKSELLRKKLAMTAFKLTSVEELREAKPIPITTKIRTAYNEFRDDGYIGGYVASQRRSVVVTSSYFTIAYLGALSTQVRPIETSVRANTEIPQFSTSSYSSVDLVEITMNETTELDYPIDAVRSVFNNAKQGAFAIVESLREQLEANNPYKNIPIKINQSELMDVMLRKEILEYCETHDPNFHIEQTSES